MKRISFPQPTLRKDTIFSRESTCLTPQRKEKNNYQLLKKNSTTKLISLRTSLPKSLRKSLEEQETPTKCSEFSPNLMGFSLDQR
jgi:hypothetical protein